MNGYAAAVRQFYDIYRPIARKYGLRMSSHTSIYDDGWIKIYKGEGADRQQIIKVEEANDTDLYDRAREAVISWENSKKERNARHVTIASIMTEKEQTGDFKIVTNTL